MWRRHQSEFLAVDGLNRKSTAVNRSLLLRTQAIILIDLAFRLWLCLQKTAASKPGLCSTAFL